MKRYLTILFLLSYFSFSAHAVICDDPFLTSSETNAISSTLKRAVQTDRQQTFVTLGCENNLLPPGRPSFLTVPATDSDGSFTLSWSSVSGFTGGGLFTLEKSVNGGGYSHLSATSRNTFSYQVSGLADATYIFRVHACNIDLNSGDHMCSLWRYSSSTVVAPAPPSTPLAPSRPSTSTGSAAISWTKPTGAVTHYDLQKRKNNTGGWLTGKLGDTNTSETLNGLTDGVWDFRVRACNGSSACSSYSSASSDTKVRVKPGVPIKPTVPSTDNDGSYIVSWVKPSGSVSHYDLQERTNGSGSWATVANNTNATSKAMSGKAENSYDYKVRACNDEDWSCSNYSAVNTIAVVNNPPVITQGGNHSLTTDKNEAVSFTLSATDSDSSTLTWSQNSAPSQGSVAGYGGGNSRTLTYTPLTGFSGSDSFSVKVSDGSKIDTISVNVSIQEVIIEVPDWAHPSNNVINDDEPVSLSVPVNQAVETLQDQAGVSGGAASYSIPIALPPGRAGMQPIVSLNYSSRSGNGVVGIGWSLSAGSNISRCSATYAQDGYTRSVQYDATNDRLCLDGQRLMAVSGVYGENGTIYHTEIDSFVKITQTYGINSTDSTFKAEYKNGLTAYYGSNSESRISHQGVEQTLVWNIQRRHDATQKNFIHFNYADYGVGEKLLTDIYYTGDDADESHKGNRRVQFNYTSDITPGAIRTDKSVRYIAGGQSDFTQKLENITTYYNGAMVRRYTLGFDLSQVSERNLLKTVEECSFDSSEICLPITTFSWQEEDTGRQVIALGYTQNGNFVTPYEDERDLSRVIPRGDRNGDGVKDFSGYLMNGEGEYVGANQLTPLDTCFIHRSTAMYSCMVGDINRDGRTDSLIHENGHLKLIYTGGGSVVTNIPLSTNSNNKPDRIVNLSDFDGDGWIDVVVAVAKTGSLEDFELYLHTRNPNTPYPASSIHLGSTNAIFKSLNNDGRWGGSSINFVGDLDGNGLPDYTFNKRWSSWKPEQTNTTVVISELEIDSVFYNMSTPGNILFDEQDMSVYIDETGYATFADVNGDGLQDLLDVGKATLRLNLGGKLFSEAVPGYALPRVNYEVLTSDYQDTINGSVIYFDNAIRFMDINSDGTVELLVPGDIVVEGCSKVGEYDWSHGVPSSMTYSDVCGSELYGTYASSFVTPSEKLPINWSVKDESIYAMKAISFYQDASGTWQKTIIQTNILGSAHQSAVLDVYGNGLADVMFVYGSRNSDGTKASCDGETICNWYEDDAANGTALVGLDFGIYVNRSSGSAPEAESYGASDLLSAATNGLNVTNEWHYLPLSSGQGGVIGVPHYQMDDSAMAAGYFHFNSSMYTVSSFKQSDGIGGINETNYAYIAAVYNTEGRGFQGFRSVIVDSPAGVRSISDFRQDFPFAGKVSEVRTCLVVDNDEICEASPLSISIIDYEDKITANSASSNPVHWIIPTSSVKETYALNNRNTLLSKQTTVINISDTDDYGNIEKSITTIDSGSVANGFSIVETTTINDYTIDENIWWINKINTSNVTQKTISGSALYDANLDPIKRVQTNYSWTNHRQPNVITITPLQGGGKTSQVDTDYDNPYGLPTSVKTIADGQTREVIMTYSSDYYFVNSATNDLNHTVTTVTNAKHGQVTQLTDANGLLTTTEYDAFGRLEKVTPPIGQPAYSRFAWCENGCDGISNNNIQYKVTTYQSGSPEITLYKDAFNRVLVAKTEGFDDSDIYVTTEYDHLGRTVFASIPSFSSNENTGTHFNQFDELNRLTEKVIDQAMNHQMSVTYSYAGARTDIHVETSSKTQDMSRTHNGTGQLMKTTDSLNGITEYAYDSIGNPIVLQDTNGNPIEAEYNALGQKLEVNDPNMGIKTFSYTGFGEVNTETDANGDIYDYDYDILGRLEFRKLNGNTEATYTFDNQCKGSINTETRNDLSGGNNYQRAYSYNSYCLPTDITTTIDSTAYIMSTQFDGNYARPKAITYPNGVTVQTLYNDRGYATHSQNVASGYVYHQAVAMDARLQLIQASKANGILLETSEYAPETGQMLSVYTDTSSGSQRHRIDYIYEGFGNLERQTVENIRNGSPVISYEDYEYDDLHRLTYARRSIDGALQTAVNYHYDAVGNFTLKSDYVSSYSYGNANKSLGGNAGANAVRSITKAGGGNATYAYDNNGNMQSGDGKTITYNAFNKPVSITKNSISSTFSYGADQLRYKQIKTGLSEGTETTIYIDKAYEVITQGSVTKKRAYLGDVILTETTGGTDAGYKIGFVHRDRLNSVVTITDENGDVVDNKSYDAFGKPRTGTFELTTPSTLEAIANAGGYELQTNRGFTDHEHLDEAELIHMNGRVYDYNLGRFLSVDPFIQEPGNSQSMNPYSYIMNNPLAGVDPSGYTALCDEGQSCDINVDDIETVGINKDGNAIVTTNDGSAYSVETVNGNDVRGKYSIGSVSQDISDIGSQSQMAKNGGVNGNNRTSQNSAGGCDSSLPSCRQKNIHDKYNNSLPTDNDHRPSETAIDFSAEKDAISTLRSSVSDESTEFVFGTGDSTGIMAFFASAFVDNIDMSTDTARIIATSMFESSFEAKYGAGDIAIQIIMEKMFKRIGGKFGSGLKSGVKKSNRSEFDRGWYEVTSLAFAPVHRTPRARLEWMNLSSLQKEMVTKPFMPVIRELATDGL